MSEVKRFRMMQRCHELEQMPPRDLLEILLSQDEIRDGIQGEVPTVTSTSDTLVRAILFCEGFEEVYR